MGDAGCACRRSTANIYRLVVTAWVLGALPHRGQSPQRVEEETWTTHLVPPGFHGQGRKGEVRCDLEVEGITEASRLW